MSMFIQFWPQYMMLLILRVFLLVGLINLFGRFDNGKSFLINTCFVTILLVLLMSGGFFDGLK